MEQNQPSSDLSQRVKIKNQEPQEGDLKSKIQKIVQKFVQIQMNNKQLYQMLFNKIIEDHFISIAENFNFGYLETYTFLTIFQKLNSQGIDANFQTSELQELASIIKQYYRSGFDQKSYNPITKSFQYLSDFYELKNRIEEENQKNTVSISQMSYPSKIILIQASNAQEENYLNSQQNLDIHKLIEIDKVQTAIPNPKIITICNEKTGLQTKSLLQPQEAQLTSSSKKKNNPDIKLEKEEQSVKVKDNQLLDNYQNLSNQISKQIENEKYQLEERKEDFSLMASNNNKTSQVLANTQQLNQSDNYLYIKESKSQEIQEIEDNQEDVIITGITLSEQIDFNEEVKSISTCMRKRQNSTRQGKDLKDLIDYLTKKRKLKQAFQIQ